MKLYQYKCNTHGAQAAKQSCFMRKLLLLSQLVMARQCLLSDPKEAIFSGTETNQGMQVIFLIVAL